MIQIYVQGSEVQTEDGACISRDPRTVADALAGIVTRPLRIAMQEAGLWLGLNEEITIIDRPIES